MRSTHSVNNIIDTVYRLTALCNTVSQLSGVLIDTGASTHIVPDKSCFTDFEQDFNPADHWLELADGSKRNDLILGRGTARILLHDNTGIQRQLLLKNALCVPTFNRNILSFHEAIRAGLTFSLNTPGYEQMRTSEGIVFDIKTSGRLYILYTVCNSKNVTHTLDEWHRLLGHCNKADILKLPALVTGMSVSSQPRTTDCIVCAEAKMTQILSRKPRRRPSVPFESISADLSGPLNIENDTEYNYVLGVVDDYSGYVAVYLLQHKTDTPTAMRQYLADITPYGAVKLLHADFGTEFTSQSFR